MQLSAFSYEKLGIKLLLQLLYARRHVRRNTVQPRGRFVYAAGGTGLSLRSLGLLVMLGMPLAMLLLAESTQWLALLLFSALFGLANGLITIVRGGLVPEYFGRTHIGRISGAMSALGLLARAAAPLLTAWLLLAVPGYREVLWALASLGVAAVLAFALARKLV